MPLGWGWLILASNAGVACNGGTQMIGEERSSYVRLRPAWRENLLWLSLIAMIVSATIFLLH
jgi:hypothetical protein